MIDQQLISEMSYIDFQPVFVELEGIFKKLDGMEIRQIVGDRCVDRLEDAFIRLVFETFKNLET